jgi:hypothetical protein
LRTLIHITLALAAAGCTGEVGTTSGQQSFDLVGAGGREIAEYWPTISVPLSENTRMLSFDMLRAEVTRATGTKWQIAGVEQWEKNRGSLGGADYTTTYSDDLTPSQQRIVLVRKMAFTVCGDLVTAEAGAATRSVFTEVDPGAAFDPAGAQTEAQIRVLYRRFFLDDAEDTDVGEAKELLAKLSPGGSDGKKAWRGLCAGYLASMRFLTY